VKLVLFRAILLTVGVAASIISVPSSTQAAAQACSLLTNAEVAKIIGRRLYDAPDTTALAEDSACTYGGGEAQIILFSGGNSEERFNSLLKGFGNENEPKQPVSGTVMHFRPTSSQCESPAGLCQQGCDRSSEKSLGCRGSDAFRTLRATRMADLRLLALRGHTCQRGSTVDGLDHLIGREVVDHVAEARKNGQLALGYLLVQPL
jgi:hypothetical protein